MIPLRWTVVLIAVGTLMIPVVSQVPSTCSWLTPSDTSGCVKEADCQSGGDVIYIWEDCPEGGELFTITNSTVSLASNCRYASGNPVVTLTKKLDAEDTSINMCDTMSNGVVTQSKLFFSAENINEFAPYPVKDTVPTAEVYVDENKKYGVATKIYYSDDDLHEAKGLSCIQISPDYKSIFSLTPVDDGDDIKTFLFSVEEKLDFEKQVFYKVEYNITSTDEKKNTRSTKQTFFVYVNDVADNPPFWSQIVPVYPLAECAKEDTLFTVTAQDRDVDINYDIKYTMVEDPEGDYFKINETTGVVSRNAPIDREELIEKGISSFSLTINATEYKNDSTEGEKPNSNEQVTIITILDCNDEKPKFDSKSYEITMDELYEASGNKDLNLKIVVTDMDEGTNGSFTLNTSDPRRLGITPQGKQKLDVTLTAFYEDNGNNYFNYEVHLDTPLNFTITAIEDADPSHTNTASVTIILRDVNDNAPEFSSNPYKKNVSESTPRDTTLLEVEADDQDQNEDFGKPSIRYSLDTSCHQLQIDNTTGKVTLAIDLNYDDTNTANEIRCSVTARDKFGTELTDTSEIIISVTDVVDEKPWFEDSEMLMTIKENSAKGDEVGSFIVNDADKEAYINFTIVSSDCSGSASTPKDVDGWFTVVPATPSYPGHQGIVKVNGNIDREACSEVTLIIMAVDWETEENADNDNGTVIITIKDVKDEPPIFKGEYGDLYIDEFDENDLPKESVPVFQVTVSDPDEGDTINLSISKGGEKLELSKSQVTVLTGEEAKVDVRTKKDEIIDREAQDTIEVEITLTNPGKEPSTSKNFSININDLNDKTPKIKADLCDKSIHVLEDDGTGSANGTVVHYISATDDDVEKPYNTVSYMMINDQLPDSKNQQTPFIVNETTGEVSVFLYEDKKTLNREQYDEWELLFRAYDHCKISDLTCKVLSSDPCKLTIIVDDVNDNDPRDLTWQPDKDITVTDFKRKDEDLGYLLWAFDDDKGENASLSYKVVSTFRPPSGEEVDLFYAVNENVTDVTSCRLYAKQDFQGMNFTAKYTVTLEARDGGNRTKNFNFTIEITDANDQPPYFVFDGCPGEADVTTIRMKENAYTPGEGRPNPMEVKCSGPDGSPFNINVRDDDKDLINREVVVEIDKVNSTVENAENEEELLNYWSLDSKDCTNGCHLQVSHKIDREKGTAYNLALHVRNKVEDPVLQQAWAKVRVVVTNAYEYDPYFCLEGNCSQIVYVYENNPEASTDFMEATDLDNTHANPGDDEYQNVFYFIVGGDRNYFQTISDNQRKIILRNMPNGLDREMRQNYSLDIYATNDGGGGNVVIDDLSRNDILHFTIYVGDVNDEIPLFPDDVIFSSFMQSNRDGDRLATIEAHDADLNETLTYTILDDLQWFETEVIPDTSFTLERKDDLSVYLKLDFDPKGMTRGYCNFTIHVKDAGSHTDEAEVKIYIINEDYQVAMYFSNNVEDVKKKQSEIEYAYSEAYSVDNVYTCVIDSITPTQSSTGESLSNETTVYMHFIDYEKNEPVDKKIILDLSDSASVIKDLQQRLDLIDINLDSVDTYFPPTNEKRPEDTILLMKILLAVVSLVLGFLLVLLITIYCIRTRSLRRKVKVLSTNTFGSKEDGLNHMGFDMVPVPGSNLAQVHGNHNPVFSENSAFEFKNQDTGSISSGDSVLVGVEDNPEFKSYSAKGETHTSSQGYENSSFGRSIDEVSAPPPGVQGGMKGNPLLNLGSLQEDNEPSTNALEHHTFGESEGSEVDAASLNQKINSNFSFS